MRKSIILVLTLFCFALSLCVVQDTNAWSKSTCLRTSGGRNSIASVAWACNQNANPTCALWIGGSNSVDPIIYVDSATSTATIYYYRMCIGGTAGTKNIWVSKDNGSINDALNMQGGTWGNPKSKATTLNVAKFIVKGSGGTVTKTQVTVGGVLYDQYRRTVNVKRQNEYANSCSSYSGACSSMNETVTVRIPAPIPKITVKLTANAVTTTGALIQSNIDSDSATIDQGSTKKLTVNNKAIAGYTFKGWRDSAASGALTSGNSYSKTIGANKTVYAVYERNVFGGRIELTGDASGSIPDSGYATSASGSPKYIDVPCSPTNGCKIAFGDYIKRISGSGNTSYKVSRTSNLFISTKGIANNANVASGNSGNASGEKVASDPSSGQFTMYPGMVVCEILAFKVYSTDTNTTNLSLCAAATGNAQPPDPGDGDTKDPSDDKSFYNIKVKNNTVSKYNTWQKSVYAKPGDNLSYIATYNPVLQYTYDLIPEAMMINGGTTYPASGINSARYLGRDSVTKSMFNNYHGSTMRDWNNGVHVQSENFATSYGSNLTCALGETACNPKTNNHTVALNEVGRSLNERVELNTDNGVKTTPRQVTFALNGSRNRANVQTTAEPKKAIALVPYNYENATTIKTDNSNVLFAGETFTVSYNYEIKPRSNSLTTDSSNFKYATTVGNPQWKVRMRVGNGGWSETNVKSRTHEDFSVTDMMAGRVGNKAIALQTELNIPDVSAGTVICLQSVIYPATSGEPGNMDANGDGRWVSSAEKCFTVAKRPSIQAWGGNVYSQKEISTTVSNKNNVKGFSEYRLEGNSGNNRVFGSWGELGIISGGAIGGFASGASTGYASNNNGILSPSQVANPTIGVADPGGSSRTSFCDRSRLTFANTCSGGKVGGVGLAVATGGSQKDKSAVVAKLSKSGEVNVSGQLALNDGSAEYSYAGGNDLEINCGEKCTVGNGIKMVHSGKTIKVNSNIEYTGSYTNFDKVPKIVIYGKNVEIGCNVRRIDALIIADSVVDTCPGSDGTKINESKNSTQLLINGAIIAAKIKANRTYGAATGANSIVPAEIINYDPTLYMWAGNEDGGTGADNISADSLDVTYIHELAPRR